MPKDLTRVNRIVLVLMENRSFDHLLGYLALEQFGHPNFARIEGIQNALNYYAHDPYPPRTLVDLALDPDPPHEREDIATQIYNPLKGWMRGFVDSYRPTFEKYSSKSPNPRLTGVMEYCTAQHIPTTDFLARNFAICDNWFAPIPASTLPNRMIAMSGYALVDHTPDGYFADLNNMFRNNPPDLLYDWLDKHSVGWAVYHEDTPFFKQMPRVFERFEADIGLGNQFKDLQELRTDALNHALPQFVFVEPRYQDDPWKGAAATDDHAPASLQGGQNFLYKVYDAISADPETWAETVLIITYDEHGSFFDHVRPASIQTDAPPGASYPAFETTGVRVPAIVVSPFVIPGYVHEGLMDHTSILKFVGEKFGDGQYSPAVDFRTVGSVSDVLEDRLLEPTTPIANPPRP